MIRMKTFLITTLLALCNFVAAQQHPEFKEIKDYFDSQKSLLKTEFQKKYISETNPLVKDRIKKDYAVFMQKIDSIKNVAYLGALIRVKNTEDLSKIVHHPEVNINAEEVEKPEFPNGINSLREKVADLFYSEGIIPEGKELNTTLKFVVEKDGSISEVCAEGETPAFNKQAEIALYLLPDKFKKPGTVNGNAVRYVYKMPIRMRLE